MANGIVTRLSRSAEQQREAMSSVNARKSSAADRLKVLTRGRDGSTSGLAYQVAALKAQPQGANT